jgi:hypothetical protein
MEDETGHREVDLRSSEVASGLIDNLIVLLRGDLEGLRERYRVSFSVHEGVWELDLEPKSRVVRSLISRTTFHGRGFGLLSMETVETSGDRTLAVFSDVETGLDIKPEELEQIFSLEPSPNGAP